MKNQETQNEAESFIHGVTKKSNVEFTLETIRNQEDGGIDSVNLTIHDDIGIVIVMKNLLQEQVAGIVDVLIDTYSYSQGECFSLTMPESPYDLVLIKKSITNRYPLGYTDKSGNTVDGHEIDIIDPLGEFFSKIRVSDEDSDDYIGFSIFFNEEVLPDDNVVNILDNPIEAFNPDTDKYDKDGISHMIENDYVKLRIERGFSYEPINISMKMK